MNQPNLRVKAAAGRVAADITPASAGWRHVGFRALRLADGEAEDWLQAERECCVVVLAGVVDIIAGEQRWPGVGGRADVFDGQAPWAAYIPAGCALRIVARGAAEVALCSAPGRPLIRPPRLIRPQDMAQSVRGQGSNTRYVTDILPQQAEADGLLVVEVRTPSGHSSSYPPHKHDRDALPAESQLEETYYHRVSPAQGFVFQRVYTDERDLDQSHAVEDGDVVLVPRGYHPVCVPHGYESYYLNVMAGPRREWRFHNDPAHEWMLSAAT
ncbi:5-deoxy-glucuronate isomerase [Chromobacterium aquaticum]|uniref:5-deoxy-glucuronate isomerase n=1 Tax=Chromobacterium aquaticum TaxID=467180 RepID=A0ABV8ZWC5_9NEIS|nr:5-deoxy-glucuronate isomerase [Chromobacterium aquaticum]MCD5364375.1 5-deoxy-glucuronate isomerase [Chromobacterium aquaticum]